MAKYNNSPIIEAVCEFKFGMDTNWDITVPGIIYNEIQKEFPNKEQHAHQNIDFTTEETAGKAQINIINTARFLSADRKTLIQVGKNTLSINQLQPYVNWSEFSTLIKYAYDILNKKIVLNSIQRVGLRYINRIEIPNKSLILEEYFKFRPFLGEELPKSYSGFMIGCMFPFFEGRDSCKVELTNVVPKNDEASAFILDIDYFLTKPQGIDVAQSLEWIENAHDEVEKIFEGCISDSLRDLFCKVK